MDSLVKRIAVVLAAAVIAAPALAADRTTACKAQDDLAWPSLGQCAPALRIVAAPGLAQPDTTGDVVAGASPAVILATHPADGVTLELAPDAPPVHTGITSASVRLAAR